MTLPDRHVFLGIALGAACLSGMVVPAFADQANTIHGVDPAALVRYEAVDYIVNYDDDIATDPTSTVRVKKVEAGKVSYVTISTTATGVYSTDAMFSSHVQYPGISVERAEPDRNFFSYWTNGRWSAFSTGNANSFVYFGVR